ncbi:MAG: hypothetical protein L0216_14340 [Planctomycetales bacterium]|nr:hypothetical protein [Planctomycetales bacterium]
MIVKKLVKHGNSRALVIDRPILELLGIEDDTPVSLTTDGKSLVLAPVRGPEVEKRFREALEEGNRRYGRMLRRLAD